MTSVQRTMTPTETPPWTTELPELQAAVRGSILRPSSPMYDSARALYNGMIDRRPALIVQCRDTADVVASLGFARRNALPVSVRAGGHGVAGTALVDGGLTIDLTPMRGVWVDPAAREAWVQGGALWGDVDHAAQLHGLAVPGGLVSNTGVGGFTLGGGVGWTSRMLGLACDNVLEYELVKADGSVARVTDTSDPELTWALRGAGTNFGVVTGFRFRLHPIGPEVYGGVRIFPGAESERLLQKLRELHSRAPTEVNLVMVLTTAPPAPIFPPEWHGKPVAATAVANFGPPAKAAAETPSFGELAAPIFEHVGAMPYGVLQGMLDPLAPAGLQNYWKSIHLEGLPDAAIRTIVERFGAVPSPMTEVHVQYFGGGEVAKGAARSCLTGRDAPFLVNVVGRWTDPAVKAENVDYVRGFCDALRPYSKGGTYVNFLADGAPEVLSRAYGEANFGRLRSLKARHDPDNVFRSNLNIPPA